MSTLELIEDILRLSGPFLTERHRAAHQHWLESRTTERLISRRQDLLESEGRPAGQRELEFVQATGRE